MVKFKVPPMPREDSETCPVCGSELLTTMNVWKYPQLGEDPPPGAYFIEVGPEEE
jgi:hypothetical protein